MRKKQSGQEKRAFVRDTADPRDTNSLPRWSDAEEKILSDLGRLRNFIEFEGLSSVHAYDDGVDKNTTFVIIDGDSSKLFTGDYNLKSDEIEKAIRSVADIFEPDHDFSKSPIETVLPGGQVFVGTLPPLSGAPRIDIYSKGERLIADTFCEKRSEDNKKKTRIMEHIVRAMLSLLLIPHFLAWSGLLIISGAAWMLGFCLEKFGQFMKTPYRGLRFLMKNLGDDGEDTL